MRNVCSVLALMIGLATVPACGGPDPSASGVFPAAGFLGRTLRVEVSGDATKWSSGATVNFGEGITVDSVAVASPTALFADITIADTAAPGLRDVTVTSGGDTVTLTQAFQLESPISVTYQGSLAQGSIVSVKIVNHDFDTPFDTTSSGDGFFTPLVYTNVSAVTGQGANLLFDSVTPYEINATMLVDVDAATTNELTIASGPEGGELTSFPLGGPLEIAARTATALTAGAAATGQITKPYESFLYEFTPASAPALARFTTSTTGDGSPATAILGPSGHFTDFLAYSDDTRQVATMAGKYYAIVVDLSGATGPFAVEASSTMLNVVSESEPNENAGAADAITLPALIQGATLATTADQDWFSFSASAASVGKSVVVSTLPGDPRTDTVVDVLVGGNSLGGPSSDGDYHESFTSDPITAAGTIFVKISHSTFQPDLSQKAYNAVVYLE